MSDTDSFFGWLKGSLLPTYFPQKNYANQTIFFARDLQYFSDNVSIRIGPPRLRQVRMGTGKINCLSCILFNFPHLLINVWLELNFKPILLEFFINRWYVHQHEINCSFSKVIANIQVWHGPILVLTDTQSQMRMTNHTVSDGLRTTRAAPTQTTKQSMLGNSQVRLTFGGFQRQGNIIPTVVVVIS